LVGKDEKAASKSLPISTIESALEPAGTRESAWPRILQEIRSRRPLIVSWLEAATPVFPESGTLKLVFGKDKSIAFESLSRQNNRRLLEQVVGEILGSSWQLEFELREELPAASQKTEPPQPVDPMEIFRNDPMIQKALELFKAEIQSDSGPDT